jgi:hypothetical protein
MRLNEFRFENDIESKIDEFGILSDKIDKVKKELNELSNRYKEIEGELRPILEFCMVWENKSNLLLCSQSIYKPYLFVSLSL